MAEITFKGHIIHTCGHLPSLQTRAHDFVLIDRDLHERGLGQWRGKKKIIATVPSLDTSTCSTMTKHLNELAKKHPDLMILVVSADLPFAQKRFCEAEDVHNVLTLSMMRDKKFGEDYGLLILEGPLSGLLARSVILLDEKDHVLYMELVPELTHEPDYSKILAALKHQ